MLAHRNRILALALTLAAGSPASPASADDWPGWLGGERAGHSSSAVPTHWSEDEGVRWKTLIPGNGYSSPVVVGDQVYVTTAYPAWRSRRLVTALDYAAVGLAAVTLLCGAALLRPSGNAPGGWGGGASTLPRRTLLFAVVLLVAAAAVFGQRLVGYDRSPSRAWFASVAVPSIAAFACVLGSPARSVWRLFAAAVTAAVFAAGVSAPVPGATADGPPSPLSQSFQLWVAVNAVPLLVCGWIAVGWRVGGPAIPADQPAAEPKGGRRGRILLGVVALTGVAVLLVITRPAAGDRQLRDVDGNIPVNPEVTLVGWGGVGLAVSVLAAGVLVRGRAGRGRWADAVVVVVGAGFLVVLAAKGVEELARRSLFLSSALGTARMEPALGWWAGYLVAAAGGLGVALAVTRVPLPGWATGFRAGVLALGVVTLANARYLRAVEEYREYVRAVVCLGADDGQVRWVCEGLAGPQPVCGRQNSPATPTPAVGDGRVYAYFGTAGLLCCDTAGRPLWEKQDLPYDGGFGPAASPVAVGGRVILTSDPPAGRSRVWAVDGASGRVCWEQGWGADERMVSGNSRTPVVARLGGRKVVLHWGFDRMRALDIDTGADAGEVRFDPRPMDIVASAVCDGRFVYLAKTGQTDSVSLERWAAGYPAVVWTARPSGVSCSTPAAAGGLLYLVTDGGVATCLDAATGKVCWRERLRGRYFASVVTAGGHAYFTNDAGLTTVVRCGRAFEVVAANDLGEDTFASPAVGGGRLFLRTATALYCMGQ